MYSGLPTKTCRWQGSTASTLSGRPWLFTGTSRQPISGICSSASTLATISSQRARSRSSLGQEQLPDAIGSGGGQPEAKPLRLRLEESMRDLHEDARAVARHADRRRRPRDAQG